MKLKTRSIVILMSCGLFACQPGKQIIHGETGDLSANKVYLCEVTSEYRQIHRAIDSAEVVNGKFVFELENVKPELYLLGIPLIMAGIFSWMGKVSR